MAALCRRLEMSLGEVQARLRYQSAPPLTDTIGTLQQRRLIGLLMGRGGRERAGVLAGMLGIKRSTLSLNAKRMIRDGLLTKSRDARDERAVFLEVSPKGREIFAAYAREVGGLFERIFEALSPSERRRLISANRYLVETYERVAAGRSLRP